jgi:Tol biopolymer transport system component
MNYEDASSFLIHNSLLELAMKTIQLSCILLFCLLMAGCGVEEERATAVPTHIAVITPTAVPPTPTQLLATDTAVPSPTNTATSLPATAVPTEIPTITPTPLPPPPGEIYFFLDPDPPPPDDESFDPRSYNFYRAIPGATANDWLVETILTDMNLEGPSITVSPDQTKLALLLLDDTDGNGELIQNVGGDIRNIYIYNRSDDSITRLTNNERSTLSVSWLPDSQAVTYPQSEEVFTTRLDDATPNLLVQLPEEGHFAQLVWSLDGQKLITHVNADLTGIRVYEPASNHLYPAHETNSGNVFFSGWSPDGRWLAFIQYGSQVYGDWRFVAVINNETLEATRLVFGEDYMTSPPDWSMDSQWLAFTKNESILSLWNAQTLTAADVLTGTNMSIPIWSPLENRIAIALVEDGIAKVLTLDPQAATITEVFQSESIQTIKLYDWSPDGQWLLLFAGNEEQSGLHIVDVGSGASYRVMDTTRGEVPREIVWLPAQ